MRLMLIISVLSAAFPSAASAQAYLGLEQPRPALTCDAAPDRQTPGCLSQGQVFVGTFENDSFGFTGVDTDRYYTHGTHFNVLLGSPAPPRVAQALQTVKLLETGTEANPVDLRWGWGWGQNIYTAEDIRLANPQDRPYAGLSYGSISLISASDRQLNTVEVQVGFVGPSAQSWFSQDERHDILSVPRARGWRHQIEDELGFALQWERRWIDRWRLGGFTLDQTDFVGAEFGTFRINASGGMLFRLGHFLEPDYGPARSWPAPATAAFTHSRLDPRLQAYAFAGYDLRVIGRDVTLNGNNFRESAKADHYWFVPEFQAGLGMKLSALKLHWAHVYRFPEFRGQNGEQRFDRVTLTVAKPFRPRPR